MLPIIFAGLASGFIADGLFGAIKSSAIDNDAKKRNIKAFEKSILANELIRENHQRLEMSIQKLINRKKGVLLSSMAEFLELYEKIKKIEFTNGEGIVELFDNSKKNISIVEVEKMISVVKQPMSESEIVLGFVFKGISGLMVEDSKRDLYIANIRVKQSNLIYSQAETLGVVFNGIIERSERIANLLAKLNLLFRESIKVTIEIIKNKGNSYKQYDSEDRKKLMNCMNLAFTIKQILDAPILDDNYEIAEESKKALCLGEEYLQKISEMTY